MGGTPSVKRGYSGDFPNPHFPKDCPNTHQALMERRNKFRQWRHTILDMAKIAVLLGTAHLLVRIVIELPSVIKEVKDQTTVIRDIHDHVSHMDTRQEKR
jgi:hypothetical protein